MSTVAAEVSIKMLLLHIVWISATISLRKKLPNYGATTKQLTKVTENEERSIFNGAGPTDQTYCCGLVHFVIEEYV